MFGAGESKATAVQHRAERLGRASREADLPRTEDPYRELAEPPFENARYVEIATELSRAWLRGWDEADKRAGIIWRDRSL